MTTEMKEVLKGIFPEYQIFETVKERGFINSNRTQYQNIPAESAAYERSNVQQQTVAQKVAVNTPVKNAAKNSANTVSSPESRTMGGLMNSPVKGPMTGPITGPISVPKGVYKAAKMMSATSPIMANISKVVLTDKYTSGRDDDRTAERASAVFAQLPNILKNYWVGSDNDRASLCKAFNRPYVKGYDSKKPKNSVLIIGTKSRGKSYAIRCISALLKQKKIFRYAEVSQIDFADYSADQDNKLLLSDLYKAVHSFTESILFENIDKASIAQMDIIYSLITEGAYKLTKRYIMRDGSLVEAVGMLNTETISEIPSKDKFFIFTTNVSEEKVYSMLGNRLIKAFGDIIKLDPIEGDQIRNLAYTLLLNMIRKSKENIHVFINHDEPLVVEIGKHFNKESGVKGLGAYIDEQLYEPLSEMKIQGKLEDQANIEIKYDNGYCAHLENGEVIKLADYTKNYGAMNLDMVKKELDGVIGLPKVKEFVRNLENNHKVQQLRGQKGLKTSEISMHMIFAGNPGTGKTMIARLVANYLKAIGVLSSGHLCEVTRADLVGQFAGSTALKTTNVINSAKGGVLFIDEAYSLCRNEQDNFGLEAIDALVKGMEDHRDDLVVILAGYEEEMQNFLNTNTGLKSRFPNVVHFEDYTTDEMYEIAKVTALSKGYKISEECEGALKRYFNKSRIKGKNDSGNGRLVRNTIESAIINQSVRIINNPEENIELLIPSDFGFEQEEEFDLEKRLNSVIGMESVKKYIRSLAARLSLQAEREKAGLKTGNTQTMHMIFAGNPGTGKTMMARTVADVLYSMNVIPTNKLVETDRSGLVAGYVGQTAIKTRQVIESALGGVLFIDEAYSLAQGGENDFGQEAIDTLVKMMDDNRESLVVILAGYSDDMKKFLNSNAGLQSRFANIIEFPDYTTDELMSIADRMYSEQGYVLSDKGEAALGTAIEKAKTTDRFGNGRYVRNIFERSLNNQALRLSGESDHSKETLITITDEDIQEVQ